MGAAIVPGTENIEINKGYGLDPIEETPRPAQSEVWCGRTMGQALLNAKSERAERHTD